MRVRVLLVAVVLAGAIAAEDKDGRRGMSFLSRMGSSRIAVQPNNAMARNGKSAAARRAEKHGIVRN